MTTFITGNEPLVASIVAAAFPAYKGKRFQLEVCETVDVRSYWGGGTRDYFAFVQVTGAGVKGGIEVPSQSAYDPKLSGADSVKLDCIPGLVCVRHSFFCGKDSGLTLMVHPSMMNPALLPVTPTADLPADEKAVMVATRSYKSSYMGVSNYRWTQSGLSLESWETAKASLISKGFLNKAGALTVTGKNLANSLR